MDLLVLIDAGPSMKRQQSCRSTFWSRVHSLVAPWQRAVPLKVTPFMPEGTIKEWSTAEKWYLWQNEACIHTWAAAQNMICTEVILYWSPALVGTKGAYYSMSLPSWKKNPKGLRRMRTWRRPKDIWCNKQCVSNATKHQYHVTWMIADS